MALTRLTPMLHVADVERSLAFYRDHLGFMLVSPEAALREYGWAHIRRDGVDLMLGGGVRGGALPPARRHRRGLARDVLLLSRRRRVAAPRARLARGGGRRALRDLLSYEGVLLPGSRRPHADLRAGDRRAAHPRAERAREQPSPEGGG